MLAKILEDMWVDPDVLEALSEEQKRILFLKMREEQVRRWRLREEEEEKAGQYNVSINKKVKSKQVSWLLGRDGDVSVSVIGEVDEFRSNKLLQNINNRPRADNLNGIQTEGRDASELGLKDDERRETRADDETLSSSPNASSEEDVDLKETDSDDSESGSSSDTPNHWAPPLYKSHLRRHDNETTTQRDAEKHVRDVVVSCDEKPVKHGGRVAELRKAFASSENLTPSSCCKPPVPTKPLHLQRAPCIH